MYADGWLYGAVWALCGYEGRCWRVFQMYLRHYHKRFSFWFSYNLVTEDWRIMGQLTHSRRLSVIYRIVFCVIHNSIFHNKLLIIYRFVHHLKMLQFFRANISFNVIPEELSLSPFTNLHYLQMFWVHLNLAWCLLDAELHGRSMTCSVAWCTDSCIGLNMDDYVFLRALDDNLVAS